MNNKKYWEFKNQTPTSADLYLYIEIASWGGGYAAHSAQSFKNELDALGEISELNIYINSPGGDVFEGNTIMNMLKRKKCTKNVYIDGLAASIASVIAMAGDKVIMPSNSMIMIHNAWTYCAGNSQELRKLADDLDKVNTSIRQAYLDKAGEKLDEETVIKLMDAETWLTAQECYDYGLCDVIGDEKSVAAKFDVKKLKNYKNIPFDFIVDSIKNTTNIKEEQEPIIENNEKEKEAFLMELDLI